MPTYHPLGLVEVMEQRRSAEKLQRTAEGVSHDVHQRHQPQSEAHLGHDDADLSERRVGEGALDVGAVACADLADGLDEFAPMMRDELERLAVACGLPDATRA